MTTTSKTLYRGERSTGSLRDGTWLTDDRDIAAMYGTVHEHAIACRILDLTWHGVGGDDRQALEADLVERGIPAETAARLAGGAWDEVYQMLERADFRAAAAEAGYGAASCMQWHMDLSPDPYTGVIICRS